MTGGRAIIWATGMVVFFLGRKIYSGWPLHLDSGTETRKVTIAGNIKEGVDTLAEGIEMPDFKDHISRKCTKI